MHLCKLIPLCVALMACGPTGSYTPADDWQHTQDLNEWSAQHGIPAPTYIGWCEASRPAPGPLYLDALGGVVCLATSEGGSVVYTYPRSQQSAAAEITLAHEYGHHWLAVLGLPQNELTPDCIAGAFYGSRHSRFASWRASWLVPYRVESRAEETSAGHPVTPGQRRRSFMDGVRDGVQGCL